MFITVYQWLQWIHLELLFRVLIEYYSFVSQNLVYTFTSKCADYWQIPSMNKHILSPTELISAPSSISAHLLVWRLRVLYVYSTCTLDILYVYSTYYVVHYVTCVLRVLYFAHFYYYFFTHFYYLLARFRVVVSSGGQYMQWTSNYQCREIRQLRIVAVIVNSRNKLISENIAL